MIIIALLLAAQEPSGAERVNSLDDAVSRADQVVEQAIECMDVQTKIQLKAHISDMTPENVVDGALASCQHLKRAYADAVTKPGSPISPASGQKLADEFFVSLRTTFIGHIEKFAINPEFADIRMKYVILEWRKCVTDKATNWSRLRDDAKTIARAAITSCHNYKMNVVSAASYFLRSKNLPASSAVEMVEKLQITVEDVAIETVIAERAKRLPAKQ